VLRPEVQALRAYADTDLLQAGDNVKMCGDFDKYTAHPARVDERTALPESSRGRHHHMHAAAVKRKQGRVYSIRLQEPSRPVRYPIFQSSSVNFFRVHGKLIPPHTGCENAHFFCARSMLGPVRSFPKEAIRRRWRYTRFGCMLRLPLLLSIARPVSAFASTKTSCKTGRPRTLRQCDEER